MLGVGALAFLRALGPRWEVGAVDRRELRGVKTWGRAEAGDSVRRGQWKGTKEGKEVTLGWAERSWLWGRWKRGKSGSAPQPWRVQEERAQGQRCMGQREGTEGGQICRVDPQDQHRARDPRQK
jgi:hypothetical protein